MFYLFTFYYNVPHCIEKTPPRSPPPTNGIRWKIEQFVYDAHPLQVRRATG